MKAEVHAASKLLTLRARESNLTPSGGTHAPPNALNTPGPPRYGEFPAQCAAPAILLHFDSAPSLARLGIHESRASTSHLHPGSSPSRTPAAGPRCRAISCPGTAPFHRSASETAPTADHSALQGLVSPPGGRLPDIAQRRPFAEVQPAADAQIVSDRDHLEQVRLDRQNRDSRETNHLPALPTLGASPGSPFGSMLANSVQPATPPGLLDETLC